MDTPRRDPIDAVLGDVVGHDDLLDVAVLVHGLRAEFLDSTPLVRSPELSAVSELASTQTPRATTATVRHGLKVTGLGVVGKVILGSTLAAASVGGLDAAGVVDLPLSPPHGEAVVAAPVEAPSTTVVEPSGLASGIGTVITAPAPRPRQVTPPAGWTPPVEVPDVAASPTPPGHAAEHAGRPDVVPVDARADRGPRRDRTVPPGHDRAATPPSPDARDFERSGPTSGPRTGPEDRDDTRPGQHGRDRGGDSSRGGERGGGRSGHTGGHDHSVEAEEHGRAGSTSGHDS